jgi:hypothetical protein
MIGLYENMSRCLFFCSINISASINKNKQGRYYLTLLHDNFLSSLAKGYDSLSSSPLASLDGFSRSHGDGLYVMQLVVAANNQNNSWLIGV